MAFLGIGESRFGSGLGQSEGLGGRPACWHPCRGAVGWWVWGPVVSLRSTTGNRLGCLRHRVGRFGEWEVGGHGMVLCLVAFVTVPDGPEPEPVGRGAHALGREIAGAVVRFNGES